MCLSMDALSISCCIFLLSLTLSSGQEWKEEVNQIRREQGILEEVIKQLQNENHQLKSRLSKVEKDNKILLKKVTKFSQTTSHLGYETSSPTEEEPHSSLSYIPNPPEIVTNYTQTKLSNGSAIRKKKFLTQQHQVNHRILQASSPSTVAFSAYISHNMDVHIGIHHTFIYDTIRTNIGNAYNKFSGIFTVPNNGLYALLWTIAAEGTKATDGYYGEIGTELIVNSVVRGKSHADTETGGDDDAATGFAILQLNQGDIVYIRSWDIQGYLQLNYREEWTFSGWQIS